MLTSSGKAPFASARPGRIVNATQASLAIPCRDIRLSRASTGPSLLSNVKWYTPRSDGGDLRARQRQNARPRLGRRTPAPLDTRVVSPDRRRRKDTHRADVGNA